MCKGDGIKSQIYAIRNEILGEKQYKEGIEKLKPLLENCDEKNKVFIMETIALANLEAGEYNAAAKIYYELKEFYQAGFCELLLGNIEKTSELWNNLENSEVKGWGMALLDFINLKIDNIPSFLQVRNHLEHDLSYFIEAEKIEYAENIIRCSDILFEVNAEAFKFIGRALMHNGFGSLAMKFFVKSQKIVSQDPEIYYHMGQCASMDGYFGKARNFLEHCIKLNKDHFPAKRLLQEIKNK